MMSKSMIVGAALLAAVVMPLALRADAKYYRYSDNRQLYYTDRNRIYRYSDNRQILYYEGEDLKMTVFTVLMLVDM